MNFSKTTPTFLKMLKAANGRIDVVERAIVALTAELGKAPSAEAVLKRIEFMEDAVGSAQRAGSALTLAGPVQVRWSSTSLNSFIYLKGDKSLKHRRKTTMFSYLYGMKMDAHDLLFGFFPKGDGIDFRAVEAFSPHSERLLVPLLMGVECTVEEALCYLFPR